MTTVPAQGACPERYALRKSFVPRARYTDPEFLARELDTVFRRSWLMACREEEIPDSGHYVVFTIADQSVIVVRTKAGEIRAHFNSCRHRGRALVCGEGRAAEFRCPFHGWRYDLEGESTFVLDRESFSCEDGELGLASVAVGTWGGWVFVNLDPDPMPLLEFLDPLPDRLAGLKLDKMRYKWRKQTVMPCNWKTAVDAFIEGYHVAELHPQLARGDRWETRPATPAEMQGRARWPTFTYGLHACVRPEIDFGGGDATQSGGSGEAAVMPQAAVEAFAAYLEDSYTDLRMMSERDLQAVQDLKTATVPEGAVLYGVYEELRAERARGAGIDWPTLGPIEVYEAGSDWHIFPNMVILPTKGAVLGYRMRPLSGDPDQCLFEAWVLEQVPDAELDQPRPSEAQVIERWREHDEWGTILPQDFTNLEAMTAGLHNDGCDGLRLSEFEESSIYNYHLALDRFMWREA